MPSRSIYTDVCMIEKGEIIMNQKQFMEAIEQHPELTASGFGVTHVAYVAAERAALANFYDAFSKSMEFLSSRSRSDLKHSLLKDSYALKHLV